MANSPSSYSTLIQSGQFSLARIASSVSSGLFLKVSRVTSWEALASLWMVSAVNAIRSTVVGELVVGVAHPPDGFAAPHLSQTFLCLANVAPQEHWAFFACGLLVDFFLAVLFLVAFFFAVFFAIVL